MKINLEQFKKHSIELCLTVNALNFYISKYDCYRVKGKLL